MEATRGSPEPARQVAFTTQNSTARAAQVQVTRVLATTVAISIRGKEVNSREITNMAISLVFKAIPSS